eukprot:GGOE01045417.1.p1 GENE.GGOE01045417.1~~GGOE01045417.1.p1  ORF type:complete len:113 (-),score=1.19 GGOE01045417.1:103-441(-)
MLGALFPPISALSPVSALLTTSNPHQPPLPASSHLSLTDGSSLLSRRKWPPTSDARGASLEPHLGGPPRCHCTTAFTLDNSTSWPMQTPHRRLVPLLPPCASFACVWLLHCA